MSAPKATELLSLARQASRAGRHLEAKKRGNALVRAEPGVPIFLFERGRIRLAAGDRRGGESDLLDVAHSDIADPILKTRALTALGASQAAAGDRAGALASFKDAFSIVPSPALEPAIQALKSKGQTCVPHERTFRGIEYVRVCAGTFDMGLRLTGKARRIAMQSFWIGKYEITNAQYGARMHPDDPSEKAKAAWPVSNVSRRNAQVFCEAAGARLPSTTEWEYAARGPDGRAYPWGNATPSPERAVYSPVGQPTDAPEPVGRRPKGVGPFGTHNQAGNVAEWVTGCPASLSEAEPDSVATDAADCDIGVVRGGAFSRSAGALHAAHSAPEIQSRHESVGFRCVLSPAP